MEQKLVSVIIPAYNAEDFIENCINCILAQTYKNFEIVVVNDGSTDSTLEILRKLEKQDARIKVLSQENGGVSAARNAALKVARGDYISYVDADDTVPETSLEDMVELMADDVDMVVCSHNEVRFSKKPHLETPKTLRADELEDRFREFDPVVWWPWGKLLRRSVIADNNLTYDVNITFGEDHIFNLLYGKYIKGKVVISDKITYNYHYIRGGLCSKYYPNMDELQKYVYIKIADFFGGTDKIPRKYAVHYIGAYFKGNVEYYIAWLSREKAAERIKNALENTYSDVMDDEILKEFFSDTQYKFLKSGDYDSFIKDYIKTNPRATIWRKFRRSVRRVLEHFQKLF